MTSRRELELEHLPEEFPAMPDGFRCVALEPIKYGTETAEALSSYFTRLCAVHRLTPSHFFRATRIGPSADSGCNHVRAKRLATINGYGPVAANMSKKLGELTGITNLRNLTALPWSGLLDPKGHHLLRRNRAWCPHCYKDSAKNGSPIYDPLYTSLRPVSVCVNHLTTLADQCPQCGAFQPFVSKRPVLEHCVKCGSRLDTPESYSNLETKTKKSSAVWLAGACSDFIRATAAHDEDVTVETYTAKLRRIMELHADGKSSILAKLLGVPRDHIANWLKKGYRPGFSLLLDICRRLNCPPSSLLFMSDELTHPDLWVKGKPREYANRSRRSAGEIKMMSMLIDEIATSDSPRPKSLKQVAREMDCSSNFLTTHFPEGAAAIRRRYDVFMAQEKENRRLQSETRIREALVSIQEQGLSTSERSLKSHGLLKPADTRRPEFKTVREEVLLATKPDDSPK